jgi:hypothetical protein
VGGSSRDISQTLLVGTEENLEFGFQIDLNLDTPEKEVRVLPTY